MLDLSTTVHSYHSAGSILFARIRRRTVLEFTGVSISERSRAISHFFTTIIKLRKYEQRNDERGELLPRTRWFCSSGQFCFLPSSNNIKKNVFLSLHACMLLHGRAGTNRKSFSSSVYSNTNYSSYEVFKATKTSSSTAREPMSSSACDNPPFPQFRCRSIMLSKREAIVGCS